ncbi:MAG: hypothetical protein HLUCCA05_11790 [Roseibaca calidilacus]|uniref:CsgH-like domain-containing protein n=1 Tax=Roseibaca calidilacus TaxID=1666912 RepID=A0A0P8AJ87_9RHOB|nr:curli-like amyloid fiber formation chaperone CsgH [Roseibaca calidilacus]KPP94494.1 MAG: hypothetical protein HLUCCA05_11790 [Roseibaca calidilacus]CUX83123.1 hypothetical protein Ga0058931_2791 [Roseibaca calidilacus]
MSAIPYTVAALVITATACAASLAAPQAHPKPDALSCALHISSQGRTVTLTAEAQAAVAMRGTYTLTVEHRGRAGRSTLRQADAFDLKAGQRSVLATASFTGRARDLTVDLTLEANGQRKTCSALTL